MKHYIDFEKDIKGSTYITDIPIEEFTSIKDIETFVKHAKNNGIGTVLHYETSNFHCGVVVQVYDIKTCECKEYLGGAVK